MFSLRRIFPRVTLGACVLLGSVRAAEDPLPTEPSGGEWIEDTLADDSLWFSSSGNLGFESMATALRETPGDRHWVHVVDDQPAWVIYYVPGELLGFEIDTHHLGAGATDFHFAAGPTWSDLRPVEADYEEITGFAANWMRLYRTVQALPADTRFFRITFPAGTDREAARLTEVWLRGRFPALAAVGASSPGILRMARNTSSTTNALPSAPAETELEPYVVRAFQFHPPEVPALQPNFAPIGGSTPIFVLPATRLSVVPFGDRQADRVLVPRVSAPAPRRGFFSTVASFFRRTSAYSD